MLSSLHKCKSISVHFIYSNRVHLALSYGTFLFIAAVFVTMESYALLVTNGAQTLSCNTVIKHNCS